MSVHDGRGTKPLPEKEISNERRTQIRSGSVGHAKQQIRGASKEEGRRSCTEGRASCENPERHAAVIAIDVRYGKAGLPILRERRPGTFFQETTRRPLPRLLQEALCLGPAGQKDREDRGEEGRQIVQSRVGIGSGLGLVVWLRPRSPGDLTTVRHRSPNPGRARCRSQAEETQMAYKVTLGLRPDRRPNILELAGPRPAF